MIPSRARDSLAPFALMLTIATAILLLYSTFAHAAADPPAPAAVPNWSGVAWIVAIILGGLGTIFGGVAVILHVIAPRTKTTADDVWAARFDAMAANVSSLGELLKRLTAPDTSGPAGAASVGADAARGMAASLKYSSSYGLLPDSTILGVPPREPEAGKARVGVLIAVAGVACAVVAAVALLGGCTPLRQAAGTGLLSALDCEAQHFDEALMSDARVFAEGKVAQWFRIGSTPSATAIRADIAPFKTDLSKCAIAGALAAVQSLATPTHGLGGVIGPVSPDPAEVRAQFAVAARQLGWAPVRVASGKVL